MYLALAIYLLLFSFPVVHGLRTTYECSLEGNVENNNSTTNANSICRLSPAIDLKSTFMEFNFACEAEPVVCEKIPLKRNAKVWYGKCTNGGQADFIQTSDGEIFGTIHFDYNVVHITHDETGMTVAECMPWTEVEDDEIEFDSTPESSDSSTSLELESFDDPEPHVEFAMAKAYNSTGGLRRRRLYQDDGKHL